MIELLLFLMFIGVFFFTGITFMGMLLAFAVVFAMSLVFGLIGAAFNLLPYILLALLAYWVFKRVKACH